MFGNNIKQNKYAEIRLINASRSADIGEIKLGEGLVQYLRENPLYGRSDYSELRFITKKPSSSNNGHVTLESRENHQEEKKLTRKQHERKSRKEKVGTTSAAAAVLLREGVDQDDMPVLKLDYVCDSDKNKNIKQELVLKNLLDTYSKNSQQEATMIKHDGCKKMNVLPTGSCERRMKLFQTDPVVEIDRLPDHISCNASAFKFQVLGRKKKSKDFKLVTSFSSVDSTKTPVKIKRKRRKIASMAIGAKAGNPTVTIGITNNTPESKASNALGKSAVLSGTKRRAFMKEWSCSNCSDDSNKVIRKAAIQAMEVVRAANGLKSRRRRSAGPRNVARAECAIRCHSDNAQRWRSKTSVKISASKTKHRQSDVGRRSTASRGRSQPKAGSSSQKNVIIITPPPEYVHCKPSGEVEFDDVIHHIIPELIEKGLTQIYLQLPQNNGDLFSVSSRKPVYRVDLNSSCPFQFIPTTLPPLKVSRKLKSNSRASSRDKLKSTSTVSAQVAPQVLSDLKSDVSSEIENLHTSFQSQAKTNALGTSSNASHLSSSIYKSPSVASPETSYKGEMVTAETPEEVSSSGNLVKIETSELSRITSVCLKPKLSAATTVNSFVSPTSGAPCTHSTSLQVSTVSTGTSDSNSSGCGTAGLKTPSHNHAVCTSVSDQHTHSATIEIMMDATEKFVDPDTAASSTNRVGPILNRFHNLLTSNMAKIRTTPAHSPTNLVVDCAVSEHVIIADVQELSPVSPAVKITSSTDHSPSVQISSPTKCEQLIVDWGSTEHDVIFLDVEELSPVPPLANTSSSGECSLSSQATSIATHVFPKENSNSVTSINTFSDTPLHQWTNTDVAGWLIFHGLERFVPDFADMSGTSMVELARCFIAGSEFVVQEYLRDLGFTLAENMKLSALLRALSNQASLF